MESLMAALLLVFVFTMSRYAGLMASGQDVTIGKNKPVVVIDAGHGGSSVRPKNMNHLYNYRLKTMIITKE